MRALLAPLFLLVLGACLPGGTGTGPLLTGLAANSQAPSATLAPRGYDRLLTETVHGFRFAAAGEPVRRGTTSERFELRNGDCAGSDCAGGRGRSEIVQVSGGGGPRINQDTWIGWSFYNETLPGYPRDRALKTVLAQWKLSGDLPAAVRIIQIGRGEADWRGCDPAVCTRGGTGDVVVHLDAMAQAESWGPSRNGGYICPLFDMQQARGTWTDIVMQTNFADTSAGYLRVWVNGALRCSYNGRIVAAETGPLGARLSHRRGVFVAFSDRWRNATGGAPWPTLVAYMDEYATGSTREAVDPALRDRLGGRPAD